MNKIIRIISYVLFTFLALLTLLVGIVGLRIWTTLSACSHFLAISCIFAGLFGLYLVLLLIWEEFKKGEEK